MSPSIPRPRGPLSLAVIEHLIAGQPLQAPGFDGVDLLVDDDFHLALWICYGLHHHGFQGVVDDEEWCPQTISFRGVLEAAFEEALREEHANDQLPERPVAALRALAGRTGPPLAATIADGSLGMLREFAMHRSAYQLKEADGHTWALPRLRGRGRSAMLEIQFDEYGQGVPGQAHAELFAAAMRSLQLDDAMGAYIDRLPGSTLATDNLVELFGLNRRLRGALLGHLALFETTSVGAMKRYLGAARRHEGLGAVERFYEVHVEADVHHADLALTRMVTGALDDEPQLAADMIFGAAALHRVESRFAIHILDRWDVGRSSLLCAMESSDGTVPQLVR